MYKLSTCKEYCFALGLSKQSSDTLQSTSQHSIAPMIFSPDEDIDSAFSRLSASVTMTIEDTNFYRLQRAAIERAKSPKMIQKSNELVPIIDGAKSFQSLCTVLAKSPYWNFLDIRMMEAMAAASLIPAAQQSVENFKRTFFGMTLSEAAPYFPIVPIKPAHTAITEQLDKDPSKMTIFELHKHRFYLETELLQTGPDTCTICRIVIGSVMITWQIHVDHAYKAYCSLKKKHSQLPPQGIVTLSINEAEMYEGLPFVWRGQEVKHVGPIESLQQQARQKPMPLPKGFQWVPFDITSVINDLHTSIPRNDMQWVNSHPLNPTVQEYISDSLDNKRSFAVRDKFTNKIVGFMQWYLWYAQIGGTLLKVFSLGYGLRTTGEIAKLMFTEMYRRVNLHGISQGLIYTTDSILKPVSTVTVWIYNFYKNNITLPHSPKTPGWRVMTSKDIPSALALTNKYTSQFEIGQVFQSEEEFSHYLMCPVIENYMQAYVVEDPVTGDITDVAAFKFQPVMDTDHIDAFVTVLVAVKSSVRQLLIDLLVCAKQAKVNRLGTLQFGQAKNVFENIFMARATNTCHLLNYQYNEVDENQVCLFCLS